MPRCSTGEVLALMDTALTQEQAAPFLETANIFVTQTLERQGYHAKTLEMIEKWLAAHLICTLDPQIAKEGIDVATVEYDGKMGEGLSGTRYGQQVLLLEYKGVIQALKDAPKPAIIKAFPL